MKNKKAMVIIIIVIISVSIVGISLFKIVGASIGVKTDNPGEAKSQNRNIRRNQQTTDEETKAKRNLLNDENTKQEILDKVNILFGLKNNKISEIANNNIKTIEEPYLYLDYFGEFMRKIIDKDDLFDKDKLLLILEATEGYSLEKYNNQGIKNYYLNAQKQFQKNNEITSVEIINIEDLKANYKKYFGEEIKSFTDLKSTINNYIYDEKNNVYYRGVNKNNQITSGLYYNVIYINSIDDNVNYIYVNTNLAYIKGAYEDNRRTIFLCDKLDTYCNNKISLYFDYEFEDYDKLTKALNARKVIDKSNYDKFTNFKIVFKKVDNNYYFEKVE